MAYATDARLRVIRNDTRKYQGENILIGTTMSKPLSIIATLDGDDWFPHNDVLSRVNAEYNKGDVWMTYGTYMEYPYRDVSMYYSAYPKEVVKSASYREHGWLASHLRTHRRELFLKIKIDDLKDEDGEFYKAAPDLGFQFPMLEMASERARHIPDVLYVYNVSNPNNECKTMQSTIDRIEMRLRSAKRYERLESLQ